MTLNIGVYQIAFLTSLNCDYLQCLKEEIHPKSLYLSQYPPYCLVMVTNDGASYVLPPAACRGGRADVTRFTACHPQPQSHRR